MAPFGIRLFVGKEQDVISTALNLSDERREAIQALADQEYNGDFKAAMNGLLRLALINGAGIEIEGGTIEGALSEFHESLKPKKRKRG